jgi:predicted transcriptional regulator
MEDHMQVKELMSTHIEAIAPTVSIQECATKMDRLGVGALPVWEDGRPVGVVTDRDICCRVVGAGMVPANTSARAVMSRDVTSCFEDQDCAEAARLMRDKGVRRLTVLNRNNTMVGVFSVDDLARCSHDMAGEVLEAVAPWPH